MKVKGLILEDTGTKVVTLPSGIYRLPNGRVLELNTSSDVTVESFDGLVRLLSKSITDKIKHKETGEEISELEYLEKEQELLKPRIWDEKEYQHHWKNLDDEFNYRKFIASYTKTTKSVYSEEEIIVEEVIKSVVETGNPFIKSAFIEGSGKPDVFVYNRPSAVLKIVTSKMSELDAKFIGDVSYGETKRELVWGNSTHSGIRYVTFGGTYIFSDTWDIKHSPKGTLEVLLKQYDADKKSIDNIIQSRYELNFGKFDDSKTKSILSAIDSLKTAINLLNKVESKQKTWTELNSTKSKLSEVLSILNNSFKV